MEWRGFLTKIFFLVKAKKKCETGLGASHLDFVRRLRLMDGRAEPGFTIARLGAWRIIII
jgi:hypothetical protein